MIRLAVLIAVLVTVPASVSALDQDMTPSKTQVEATELAVMTEREKTTCDWYDHWYDSKSGREASACAYEDYWTDTKAE